MYPSLRSLAVHLIIATLCTLPGIAQSSAVGSIDSAVAQAMSSQNIPALAVAIVKSGTIVYSKAYGQADRERNITATPQTLFAIASCSKMITAVAVMQLVEQGKMRLDADINTYLPFSVRNPNFPAVPITVQMLLTHTSSLNDGSSLFDYVVPGDSPIALADFMRRSVTASGDLFGQTAEFGNAMPGTQYKYSNMGTSMLGYLVEAVAAQPFNQYCNQRIFTPLCMNSTRWFLSELDTNTIARPYRKSNSMLIRRPFTGFPDYPDGQLRSTVLDLSKFMWAMMNSGTPFSGVQLLQPETTRRMLSVASVSGSIGLHCFYEEIGNQDTVWGHDGALEDVQAEVRFLKGSDGTGVVVIANTSARLTSLWQTLLNLGRSIAPAPNNALQCTAVTSVRSPEQQSLETLVEVSPNPASDILRLRLPAEGYSLQLVDMLGRTVVMQTYLGLNIEIPIQTLTRGAYYLVLSRGGSVVQTKQIVKL